MPYPSLLFCLLTKHRLLGKRTARYLRLSISEWSFQTDSIVIWTSGPVILPVKSKYFVKKENKTSLEGCVAEEN